MIGLLLGLALAGETEVFVGGGGDTQVGWESGAMVGQVQAEADFRVKRGLVYARFDVDTTYSFGQGFSLMPPEWAMVQVGPEAWRVRGGVLNPQVGYEDWDAWLNYLPTWSVMFNAATPGRVLGGEVDIAAGEATRVFAWGGLDIDWAGKANWTEDLRTPTFGLGATSEGEMWATWSGVFAVPKDQFYGLVYSVELYPLDALSVLVDGSTGLVAGAPYGGGQVVLVGLPEATAQPIVRGEWVVDPGKAALGGWAAGVPDATVSLGTKVAPLDWLQVMVEGKGSFAEGTMHPGIWLGLEIVRPEPTAFEVALDEE